MKRSAKAGFQVALNSTCLSFFNKTNTLFDYFDTQPIIVHQKGFIEATQLHGDELLDRFEHCKLSLQRLPLPINKVFFEF